MYLSLLKTPPNEDSIQTFKQSFYDDMRHKAWDKGGRKF